MKKVGITPGPVKFENMEPNDVKQFTPSNTGTEGQILTKTSNGYNWKTPPDVKEFTPSNTGTTGQVLTKTNDGYNWATPSGGGGGGGSNIGFNFINEEFHVFPGLPGSMSSDFKTANALINYDIILYDENNSTDTVSGKASVVFNADAFNTSYYVNVSLSCSKLNGGSKYYVIINGMLNCTLNTGEVLDCDGEFYGTAMFSKTPATQASGALQNIKKVVVNITDIDFRVNE